MRVVLKYLFAFAVLCNMMFVGAMEEFDSDTDTCEAGEYSSRPIKFGEFLQENNLQNVVELVLNEVPIMLFEKSFLEKRQEITAFDLDKCYKVFLSASKKSLAYLVTKDGDAHCKIYSFEKVVLDKETGRTSLSPGFYKLFECMTACSAWKNIARFIIATIGEDLAVESGETRCFDDKDFSCVKMFSDNYVISLSPVKTKQGIAH